jgi:hypothetical protein
VHTEDLAEEAEDPMAVLELTDTVRERIQQSLYRLLVQRESTFSRRSAIVRLRASQARL